MKRFFLCAALLAWSGLASAVVYKWTDSQGKIQYGDRPPTGVHAEVVELLGTHAARSAPSAPSHPDSPAASNDSKSTSANAAPTDDATKQAVAEDVAQVKEKQCVDAQDRYKKLIEGRRIYKAGPDGERQYLTSAEIDSERLNAKREIDAVCNSPN